jgi:2-oxoglutarate dehydrogenase E1 component
LYKLISKHPNPRDVYVKKLSENNEISVEESKKLEEQFNAGLQKKLDTVKAKKDKVVKVERKMGGPWATKRASKLSDFDSSPDTAVDKKTLKKIGEKLFTLPTDINVFRKVSKLFGDRLSMLKEGKIDWALGELLAYGTLVHEGYMVRLSGQDVERGTFSHRHAVVKHEDSDQEYVPLNHLSKGQAPFEVYNSLLSEYGVLGFEYGYASVSPERLIIWEAQFGDFGNETQVIMDQYISSAEDKWVRQNGIVMLLPHGYEGQGAEHSSARMERYLQQCAEQNIQVVNCSTPANMFHVLRRQLYRDFCKPLIVFTPKSLLRHPACISSMDDLSKGGFKEVIDDDTAKVKETKKVVFCCGKIYYELKAYQEKTKVTNMVVVRVEQLYPLPLQQLKAVVGKYKYADEWVWLQEEPINMGAWTYIFMHFKEVPLTVVARPESATTATGSSKQHKIEQLELFEQVLDKSLYKEKDLKDYLTHFAK